MKFSHSVCVCWGFSSQKPLIRQSVIWDQIYSFVSAKLLCKWTKFDKRKLAQKADMSQVLKCLKIWQNAFSFIVPSSLMRAFVRLCFRVNCANVLVIITASIQSYVTLPFVCHLFCRSVGDQDNSQVYLCLPTKHGRRRQGVTLLTWLKSGFDPDVDLRSFTLILTLCR